MIMKKGKINTIVEWLFIAAVATVTAICIADIIWPNFIIIH